VDDSFRSRWPRLAALRDEAEADVLASLAFPAAHWRQIWRTNPLEPRRAMARSVSSSRHVGHPLE
jgi:transposase-like protein